MSGSVSPSGRLSGLGVTAMLTSGAAVTVTVAVPVTPDSEATMLEVPLARAVTRPRVPAAFDTDAMVVVPADQTTESVRSAVDRSE